MGGVIGKGLEGWWDGVVWIVWDGKGYGELIILVVIGGVEWVEEIGGVGGGVVGNFFNIFLGFKFLWFMVIGDIIGIIIGGVFFVVIVDEEWVFFGDFFRVIGDVDVVELWIVNVGVVCMDDFGFKGGKKLVVGIG